MEIATNFLEKSEERKNYRRKSLVDKYIPTADRSTDNNYYFLIMKNYSTKYINN